MTTDLQLHVLIVDDEQYVRGHLRNLLESRSEVDELAEASHGREAVQAIEEGGPDLVFLDIKMPTTSGIEVVEEVGPESMPATVFVTAYDEYAIQAFDLAAIDYLLKPFDEDRFEKAFERALRALKMDRVEDLASHFQDLLDVSGSRAASFGDGTAPNGDDGSDMSDTTTSRYLERFTVERGNKVHIIPVEDVRFVTAEDMYVRIHTEDNSYLLRERLYEMENRLDPAEFIRIHRSSIVRIDCIHRLVQRSGGDYVVQLDDAKTLRVSRSRQEELLQRLETGTSA